VLRLAGDRPFIDRRQAHAGLILDHKFPKCSKKRDVSQFILDPSPLHPLDEVRQCIC
jgi:hypothetical protein